MGKVEMRSRALAVLLPLLCPWATGFVSFSLHPPSFLSPWNPSAASVSNNRTPSKASSSSPLSPGGSVSTRGPPTSDATPAWRTGALLMEAQHGPLDRHDLIRAVGGTLASLVTASAAIASSAERASAAGTAVARRPAAKRSPVFLCNDAVSYLQNPAMQSEMWIVGTAHISNSSAQLVENVIREVKPQVVMVELDAQRVVGFLEEEKKKYGGGEGVPDDRPATGRRKVTPVFGGFLRELLDPGVSTSDKITDFFAFALGTTISKMYQSMDQQGLASGQEFSIAIHEARSSGAKLLLGDRDVKETLRRLSQALSVTDFEGLAEKSNLELGLGLEALEGGGAASLSSSVEKLKRRETMQKVTSFYKREAPELYTAMVGERDKVMAGNLMGLEGKQKTVAVVGLAHVDGIEAILSANGWKCQQC